MVTVAVVLALQVVQVVMVIKAMTVVAAMLVVLVREMMVVTPMMVPAQALQLGKEQFIGAFSIVVAHVCTNATAPNRRPPSPPSS